MQNIFMTRQLPNRIFNNNTYLSILYCLLIGLFPAANAQTEDKNGNMFRPEPFALFSSAFGKNQKIPGRYTADGRDVSPPLYWTNVPQSTVSFALLVEDPDAPSGTWTHWIIYDIPAGKKGLKEAISPGAKLPDGTIQGMNSFHKCGYGGPNPPRGSSHRYFFTLYALDCFSYSTPSFVAPEKDMQKFKAYLNLHAKGQTELVGIYSKR